MYSLSTPRGSSVWPVRAISAAVSLPLPTPLLLLRSTGLGDAAADGLRGEGPACCLELGRRGSGEGATDDGWYAAGGESAWGAWRAAGDSASSWKRNVTVAGLPPKMEVPCSKLKPLAAFAAAGSFSSTPATAASAASAASASAAASVASAASSAAIAA